METKVCTKCGNEHPAISDLLELAKQLSALSSEEKKMLDKILNEPQIEARSVKENEQKENICRNEKCILRHELAETCSIYAVRCPTRQI